MGTKPHDQQQQGRPAARAWHIDKPGSMGETVVANDCVVLKCGVLVFLNVLADTKVLVRAFSSQQWFDCKLIDTPFAPAANLEFSRDLLTSRRQP